MANNTHFDRSAPHRRHNDPTTDPCHDQEATILLAQMANFIARYVQLPSVEHLVAVALWVVHTHCFDCFESTPRLAVISPERECGKTRLFEVMALVVARPLLQISTTAAALFHAIAAIQPTILLDEVDNIFGPGDNNSQLRAVLNSGHRQGATVLRSAGATGARQFPVFAPVALAGIGNVLPDTLASRCIYVPMHRRGPGDTVDEFRYQTAAYQAAPLHDRLTAWADRNAERLMACRPEMPATIHDRRADVWEPLLAVATVAGPQWAMEARKASEAIEAAREATTLSLGSRLLADLHAIFHADSRTKLATSFLISKLIALDESPWADFQGGSLDARGLARLLRPYRVYPKDIRTGHQVVKGYTSADLAETWRLYLRTAGTDT